jgi:hypothetical protein
MKIKSILFALVAMFSVSATNAQVNIPSEFVKGSVTLADGSVVSGYIKDNIKRSASVVYIDNAGVNKKTYEAIQINGVTIGTANFVCISGDFFKTLSTGKMNFLQKASNASGKLSYNGTEAVLSNGTDGKVGDYFVYTSHTLKLLNKKSLESFINTDLAVCAPAVEKAKAVNGDIARLQEAVDIYNKN